MSAKGLPPAVRLDPLPLLSTCASSGHNPYEASQAHSPTSILSPSHNSPRPQTMTLARGLTPIIITPESCSRPHTPAIGGGSDRGTPGLTSLQAFTTTMMAATTGMMGGRQVKRKMKFEPVELDPILPSVKQERKVRAVRMDEDEGTKLPQLPPTPCMTPVLHPVDLIEGERGPGGEEMMMMMKMVGDNSPRTGRTILPAFRSRPDDGDDDPAAFHRRARNLNLSDLASVAERERLVYDEEDGRRGRTKERRKSSRFREEKVRYKPYDPGMRSINCQIQSRSRRLRFPSSSSSTMPQSAHPLHPPSRTTANDGPQPPPPQPPQPSSLSSALPPIAPPYPIPKAADHLIHLFNTELENQIQAERDSLRSEYETLARERSEIQRERDLMRRERDQHRSYEALMGATKEAKDRESVALREENQMLRNRVEELQIRLESMLREAGRRSPTTS